MKKLLLLLVLCCIGAGICFEAYANRKRPKITSVYLEKKMAVKGPRSVMPPINAVLSPDGNTITLYSPENCDRAFGTIAGGGTGGAGGGGGAGRAATLDVSDLDCGVYLITVEYENGTIYTGHIEFLKI